jgi:hypothetical protein
MNWLRGSATTFTEPTSWPLHGGKIGSNAARSANTDSGYLPGSVGLLNAGTLVDVGAELRLGEGRGPLEAPYMVDPQQHAPPWVAAAAVQLVPDAVVVREVCS